jgi:NitT/TauT family transport system substrate-binding protein
VTIRLQESLRGLFYAPFYIALAQEAYAAEGVDVVFVASPRPGDAALAVLSGAADVCWGGPMRVMQAYQSVRDCDLVSFAEVVTRDPFLLIGAIPKPHFTLHDLVGSRVATVSEVRTPWMCLQEDLRRVGIDPASLDRIGTSTMGENCMALARGEVDVVQVFEPLVSEMVESGRAHVWYAAATRGPTSYTTFYTRRHLLVERRTELHRMVRAIYKVQRWVQQASAAEVASPLATYFPGVPLPILAAACGRYKALGLWGTTPIVPRSGYDRLRASLVSGGFVQPGTPFEVAVDNGIAEAVVRGK